MVFLVFLALLTLLALDVAQGVQEGQKTGCLFIELLELLGRETAVSGVYHGKDSNNQTILRTDSRGNP